jgi:integrase
MVSLTRDSNGNYRARKRIPAQVKAEHGRLYDVTAEEKFYRKAEVKDVVAKREFNEWLAEIETRIANIRAQQNDEGISLTRLQARALAGQWYDWFVGRHPFIDDIEKWEHVRDDIHEVMRQEVGDKCWEKNDPDNLWREDESLRKTMRPLLSDAGETAQFLAVKRLALDNETHALFLDFLYEDLAAALLRFEKIADGYFGPDKYRERFPKFEGVDTGDSPLHLFDRWVAERKPSEGTIESWQYVFREMEEKFKGRSAGSVTADEARAWIKGMVSPDRSAGTVSKTWLNGSNTVFGWAADQNLIPSNPFADVTIIVPKKTRLRETPAFFAEEQTLILKAALQVTDASTPDNAARRWVPWLCAYTGARVGEITQLRKQDVIERDGVYAIHITPAAGAVKTRKARTVPIHEHLIAQGFLDFVSTHKDGPLFYNPPKKGTNGKKPRNAQARQRLAAWVRALGISVRELQPNHAWRHTFKQIADHVEISERMSNYITGHAQRNEGAKYGPPILAHMAKAMEKFPRYVLS